MRDHPGMDENDRKSCRSVLASNLTNLMEKRKSLESNPKLGKKSGVGIATLSRIRNGETAATIDTLEALAKAFELEPWQLLVPGLDPSNPQILQSSSPQEAELYRRLRAVIAKEAEVQAMGTDSGFQGLEPHHPARKGGDRKTGGK